MPASKIVIPPEDERPAGNAQAPPRAAATPARKALALLKRTGFSYAWFRVYRLSLDQSAAADAHEPEGYECREATLAEIEAAPRPELRACARYAGENAFLFAAFAPGGVIECVQCVWYGARYGKVAFWPVEDRAAVSMHLVTARTARGKGLATHLKRHSARVLHERGFSHLYSRIWWSHTASLRVSEKAGWKHVGSTIEVRLPMRARAWEFAWRRR